MSSRHRLSCPDCAGYGEVRGSIIVAVLDKWGRRVGTTRATGAITCRICKGEGTVPR